MGAPFPLGFPFVFSGIEPSKSHRRFNYYFDDNYGICFGPCGWSEEPWKFDYDLAIYYDSLTGNDFIDCFCGRWDVQNFSVVVETWLKKADFQALINNTRPGATGELYKILGRPLYYDKSWGGYNTIKLKPTPSSNLMNASNLKNMRKETIIYPKNITYSNVPTKEGWIHTKIEGMISGSGDL